MIPHVIWRLSIWNHPHVITGIQINRGDPPPWWLDEGQSHRSLDAHSTPNITHVRPVAAFTKRACPPIRDGRNIEASRFRIGRCALPIGCPLIVRNRQCAAFAACAFNDRGSVERTELELRCNAHCLSFYFRREVDEIVFRHTLPIEWRWFR